MLESFIDQSASKLLSVFIIAKNEEKRIAKTIKSVQDIANEIIVVDSGSEDSTCQIAEDLGCRVLFNKWQGFGKQKVFAENQCKNHWVLNLDADEELSLEARQEIMQILNSNLANFSAFRIKIVNQFHFETKPHKMAYYYNQIRLYNKNEAGFSDSPIHDSVIIGNFNKQIGQVKAIIYHQSFLSFSHWLGKINFYSDLQALDAFAKNKKRPAIKIFINPILAFFKAFFIRRYFIYGVNGLIYSLIFAFSRFAKEIKIYESFALSHLKKSK